MHVECDCGLTFTNLVRCDDGSICWTCPNCGDCKEWF